MRTQRMRLVVEELETSSGIRARAGVGVVRVAEAPKPTMTTFITSCTLLEEEGMETCPRTSLWIPSRKMQIECTRSRSSRSTAEEASKLHSSGIGGAGNIHLQSNGNDIDMSHLSLEEREAYAKVHANDIQHGFSTGKGGAGNIHTPSTHHSREQTPDGERGREHSGVLGSVLRSLSRATGREKSTDRSSQLNA